MAGDWVAGPMVHTILVRRPYILGRLALEITLTIYLLRYI
jgi:hypothetical protein